MIEDVQVEDVQVEDVQVEETPDDHLMRRIETVGEEIRQTTQNRGAFSATVLEHEVQQERKEYSWQYENLVGIPIEPEQCIIALDSVDGRLFVMYDDMTLIEVNLQTKQMVSEINLGDIEDAQELCQGKKTVSFAMFKDLNMLAISTDSNVHLFDYENELTLVTTLSVPNVISVTFIELYIVLLIESEDGSEAKLECYQIDSDEAEASITIK